MVEERVEAKERCGFRFETEAVETAYFLEFGNRDVCNEVVFVVVSGKDVDFRDLQVVFAVAIEKLIQSQSINAFELN